MIETEEIAMITEKYNKLREIYSNESIIASRKELLEILWKDEKEKSEEDLRREIRKVLSDLSMQIQSASHRSWVDKGILEKTPHTLHRLRANRLGESMTYADRLMLVLSNPDTYIKLRKDYIEERTKPTWYNDKPVNKSAVNDNIMQEFFKDYFVLDPRAITDDMITYLLDNKSLKTYMTDPSLQAIKRKFARPYFLQYKLKNPKTNAQEPKATSRIMFFRWTPAIGVFRSADSHPIVTNPTKHEKRKKQKGMDMYMTDSSYDIITQQYQAIANITDKKWGTSYFVTKLIEQLKHMKESDTQLDKEQLAQIQKVIEALEYKTNPTVLMTKLYHLSQIPYFQNKVIQWNLLGAAIDRLSKREKELGSYLYYMIPQLQALETIHTANKENIETLHRKTLMCAAGNNPRSFAEDESQKLEQFNKNKASDKITRRVRQHSEKQEDHLIGLFYTMHKQIQTLLKNPNSKDARIIVYSHRFIMAAEQLKQNIQVGTAKWSGIETHKYFQEILADTYDQTESFIEFYKAIKETDSYIKEKKRKKAIEKLNTFKTALEPNPNSTT